MHKNKTPLDVLAKLLENPSPNLSVDVYNDDVEVIKEPSVKKRKSKYTLNQVSTKLDQISDAIVELTKSFASFKQEVDERFNRIDARLDYNGLKKLPVNR